MAWWKIGLLIAALSVLGWVTSMMAMSLLAQRPETLGIKDGRLAPCPSKPNCVSSQDESPDHHIEPFPIQGDPEKAWKRLLSVLKKLPRTRLVTQTDNYLHAECTSLLFRFVDDLECQLDATRGVIQVRSASRAGHSDLGVNRARVEAIREAFEHSGE